VQVQFRWVVSILLGAVFPLLGQTSRGALGGMVLDPQKLAVPNASIEVTNLATNLVRSNVTNGEGIYRFDALEPGLCKVVVRHQGFRAFTAQGLEVSAAQPDSFRACD
jgi:hypothetical protein